MTDTNFGNRLAELRKQRGLTQQAVAAASGAHVTQIRRYEAGTSQPTLDVLRNLAFALNTSPDSLLFDPDERGPENPTPPTPPGSPRPTPPRRTGQRPSHD